MLKYQSTASAKHTHSSPQIDLLLSMAKLTAASNHHRLPSEKQQIDSIRSMGKYLLQDETDSTVTFEERGKNEARGIRQKGGREGLTIYERGQLNVKKKLEKIVNAHKAETQRILNLSKTSANTLNATKTNVFNKSQTANSHPTTYRTKDSFRVQELLKKCINEEGQLRAESREKKARNRQRNPYLNQTAREVYGNPKKGKRTATKQQLQMIFEEVNQRSVELKRRKQTTIQHHLTQKYEREMSGVTFHPHLPSSKTLRNSCTQGFLRRLERDHHSREHQKIQILAEELRRDSYQPRLNSQRNSLSKSKIDSFRINDSAFFTARSKPEQVFEKSLSRFIYPEEDSMADSRGNNSIEIAVKANDLQFLFQ